MIKEPVLKKKSNVILRVISNTQKNISNSSTQYRVYCVDDDPMIRAFLKNNLKHNPNLQLAMFEDGESCIKALNDQPEIVILDFHLTPCENDDSVMNGLGILEKIKELSPSTSVIMLSSQDEISVAVKCLKKGAKDYIIKDNVMGINVEKSIGSVIKSIELRQEIRSLSETIKRDKLLIRGYFSIFIFLVLIVAFLLFKN